MLNIDKDALATLFTSKYKDPYTRQEYFGGLLTTEYEVLSGWARENLHDVSKESGEGWFLLELSKEFQIKRLHPELPNMEVSHTVVGVLETRAQTQCPLTSKKSSVTFKYYVTKKMMDEIKKLAK